MKRLLCITLALIMCLSLISCGKSDVQEEPPADETVNDVPEVKDEETEEKEEEPPVDPATIWNGTLEHRDEEGFYDPNYDYSANPRYKVCVFTDGIARSELYEAAIARWCDVMNIEFGGIINPNDLEGNDHDNLRELAREYDGIILTHDYGYTDILNEEGCPWIFWMYESHGEEKLKAPVVIHSFDGVGAVLAENAASYYEENLADVPVSQVGVMYVTFSASPVQYAMEAEFMEAINNIAPELAENVLVHDMAAGPVSTDRVTFDEWYNIFLEENTQYTYWLCCAIGDEVDDASAAFLRNGFEENAYIFAGVIAPETYFGEDGIPLVVSCFCIMDVVSSLIYLRLSIFPFFPFRF